MLIEQRHQSVIHPDTALGSALVAFFDVLKPLFAHGEQGVFKVIVFGNED